MEINYKAVIFDFNGTLFFDNDKHIKAWSAVSQNIRGHGISEEELHAHINGVPNKQIIQYLMQQEAPYETIQKFSDMKERFYRRFCREDKENFHLVRGVTTYFDFLKAHDIPFTIASASIKKNIDFFIASFHLDKWIHPQDIIYDDGTYENKIAMFLKAAQVLQTDIKDILIIEDSMQGIKSATQAGCKNIIVIDSANKKEIYENIPNVKKVIPNLTNIENEC